MTRPRYPALATETELRATFLLEFVAHGPTAQSWEGDYLKCPECLTFVHKGGDNHRCPCGNVCIDSDMLRVIVTNGPESTIETYRASPK